MDKLFAAYCKKNNGDNSYPRGINYFTLQQVNIVIFTTSAGKIL
jgi:response regulator of citrate/malate metabolism